MSIWSSFWQCIKQYTDFHGRTRRRQFFDFAIVCFVIAFVTSLLDELLFDNFLKWFTDIPFLRHFGPLLVISMVLLASPVLAATTRRLHDMGKSGLWIILFIVPVIGWLALLYMTLQPTQNYDNNWGFVKRKPQEEEELEEDTHYNPFDGNGERPNVVTNETLFADEDKEEQKSREGHL